MLPIVVTGILVFADAWVAGVRKRTGAPGFLNLSSMGWGIAVQGLAILALPLYLLNRNKLRTKEGNKALWVTTAVLGSFVLIWMVGGLVVLLINMK